MKLTSIGLLALSLLAAGCGSSVKKNCKEFCEKLDECGGDTSVGDCRDDCESELEDAEKECRQAFADVSDCLSPLSCVEIATSNECTKELADVEAKCPDSCCDAADSCEFANDNFCDCPEQPWDAVDCADE